MKLLYPEEHLSCVNYRLDKSIGFSLRTLKKGEEFVLLSRNMNYILFVQSGKMRLAFKEVENRVIFGGEMLYLPSHHEGKGFAEDDVDLILLSFDNENFQLCEEYAVEHLAQHVSAGQKKAVTTPIYPPMQQVLDSIKFYLNNKVSCMHLHQIKQKEVFLILRAFYSKKENADFFASLFVSP